MNPDLKITLTLVRGQLQISIDGPLRDLAVAREMLAQADDQIRGTIRSTMAGGVAVPPKTMQPLLTGR